MRRALAWVSEQAWRVVGLGLPAEHRPESPANAIPDRMAELFRRHGYVFDACTGSGEAHALLVAAVLQLEDKVAALTQAAARPQPLRCPVCDGTGRVPAPWYDIPETGTVPCAACAGKGLVWRGAR